MQVTKKNNPEKFKIEIDDAYSLLEDDFECLDEFLQKSSASRESSMNNQSVKDSMKNVIVHPSNSGEYDKERRSDISKLHLGWGMESLMRIARTSVEASKKRDVISFLLDMKPGTSKWASKDKIGQEELYVAVEKVLNELKSYTPHCTPFLQKVSKRDVPDYYEVIKRPMDLGKMTKKLKFFEYQSTEQVQNDLDLIWANCYQFNVIEGNLYRVHASEMKKKADMLMENVPDIVIQEKNTVDEILGSNDNFVEEIMSNSTEESVEKVTETIILEDSKSVDEKLRDWRLQRLSNELENSKLPFPERRSFFRSERSTDAYIQSDMRLRFPEFLFFSSTIPDAFIPKFRHSNANISSCKSAHAARSSVQSALKNINLLRNIKNSKAHLDGLEELDNIPPRLSEPSTELVDFDCNLNSFSCKLLLRKTIGLLCLHEAFEFGEMTAINILADLALEYLFNFAKTAKYLSEYAQTSTNGNMEKLRVLFHSTSLNVSDLSGYCKSYVSDVENRLNNIEKSMQEKLNPLIDGLDFMDFQEELSICSDKGSLGDTFLSDSHSIIDTGSFDFKPLEINAPYIDLLIPYMKSKATHDGRISDEIPIIVEEKTAMKRTGKRRGK